MNENERLRAIVAGAVINSAFGTVSKSRGTGVCTSTFCHRIGLSTESGILLEYCVYCATELSIGEEERWDYCPHCKSLEVPGLDQHFGEWKYDAENMDHDKLRKHLSQIQPPDEPSNEVASHARLYIFAHRFMIAPLQKLCLHKLHRDLTSLKLDETIVSELIELLQFTYQNTSSDAKIGSGHTEAGVGKELRSLVITYAACKAEKLVKYKEFKAMLTEGGELVADFACLTASRLNGRVTVR